MGVLEAVVFRVRGRVAQAERAGQIDHLHAQREQDRRQLERSIRGRRQQHHRALSRELGDLVLRRVLDLAGAAMQARAPGSRLAGPLVAAEQLQLDIRMRRQDPARLDARVAGSANDTDGHGLHAIAYLCNRAADAREKSDSASASRSMAASLLPC